MSGAVLAAGARVFSRSTAPPLYYRNNVAADATEVRAWPEWLMCLVLAATKKTP
jgi:hypothetical protein